MPLEPDPRNATEPIKKSQRNVELACERNFPEQIRYRNDLNRMYTNLIDAIDCFLSDKESTLLNPNVDLIPATIITTDTIHKQHSTSPLVSLLDSGSSHTLINRKAIPSHCKILTDSPSSNITAAGTFQTSDILPLHSLKFIEFSATQRIDRVDARIFDSPDCPYDVIIGRDLLVPLQFEISWRTRECTMGEKSVPMKSRSHLQQVFFADADEPVTDDLDDGAECFYSMDEDGKIKESLYEKVEPADVVAKQTHLTEQQRTALLKTLSSVTRLFSGELGTYEGKKISLELKEGAEPVHCKPYAVPRMQEDVFKKECQRLCDIRVLEPIGATEHAYPTFCVAKKDGRIRWVSDFRLLNANLKRKVFPLPRIQDVLTRRKGYKYFTKLDISMCYYTFQLDEASSNMCVIVTPFQKYRYLRLPMGLSCSPDFCQEIMHSIFQDMDDVVVYIDDIGIWSDSYDEHMRTVTEVLKRLDTNGFTVNPLKCEWAVTETDWLGYWLTPTGLKPWKKKISAILRLKEPSNMTELRSFIGAVNYYRDMFPRRAHMLAPLTSLTGKEFVWNEPQQQAFNNLKTLLSTDAIMRYPDHNKPFVVYTDASDYQLGSVIMQDEMPVAYYSRKLTSAQKNYTTIEKELLSIVETFREFRTMLLGARITVFTDHKNLTFNNLNTQRVLRWRLFLEEYAPTFKYIEGPKNVLADFLSRHPIKSAEAESTNTVTYFDSFCRECLHTELLEPLADHHDNPIPGFHEPCPFNCCRDTADFEDHVYSTSILDDPDLADSWLRAEPGWESYFIHMLPNAPNPIEYRRLSQVQQQSNIWNMPQLDPIRYSYQTFGNVQIVCYRPQHQHNFRIMLPTEELHTMILWFHQALNHVGGTRLFKTMSMHCYHPQLFEAVKDIVSRCASCQQHKLPGRGYGELPPREANVAPFYEIAVDLIGPWNVTVQGTTHTFRALTIVDTVTNLTELVRIDRPTAAETGWRLEQSWLSRYPRPVRCIYDQGGEFIGSEFQNVLNRAGIQGVPTTVRNPQANAICERMHQTMAQMLKTQLLAVPPQDLNDAIRMVERCLASAQLALRATIHHTMGISPGALVFHRDMLFDVPYVTDLLMLRDKRQALIDYTLRRENNRRRSYDYAIGDSVLELVPKDKRAKLGSPTKGPFIIERIHTNGTVTIRRSPLITERVNIRNIRPFHL